LRAARAQLSPVPSIYGTHNKVVFMVTGELWRAVLFILAAILAMRTSTADAQIDHAAIARASLTEVIRPGYAALATTTGVLKDRVEALCKLPSADAFDKAKSAFAGAVDAWSKVEILRFGPITKDQRYERLFYWPDAKSTGLRQVQDTLAKRENSVTLPDELATKNAALQGLPALEYLLYGGGAEALTKNNRVVDGVEPLPNVYSEGAFRCSFALSVATNVSRIARSLVEAGREGSAYEKAFLGPAPDNRLYHTPKEVTHDLFKSFASGIELVRQEKLGKPLGATSDEAKPKLAAFWRSGLTFANAAGNLEGVRALFAQGGFAKVVAFGVEESIVSDLDRAIGMLRAIDRPFSDIPKDDGLRAKISAARVALKSAEVNAGESILHSTARSGSGRGAL